MDDPAQAQAYAAADFEAPHAEFINLLQRQINTTPTHILELGCGTGDITWRLAQAFPDSHIDALDGAQAMLQCAENVIQQHALQSRVQLLHCHLPTDTLATDYDAMFCNATLHHLNDPLVLWQTIKQAAQQGADIFVMDLARPASLEAAAEIITTHAANEAEILKQDFYNSLLAAYSVDEIREQLDHCGLSSLTVEMSSDRHWAVSGQQP